MKKWKQALSLTLALALSLTLAVPAMAVGTTEKITLDNCGSVVTVTNVVKVVTEWYNVGEDPVYGDGKITGQEEFTILVVSDSGYTMTFEAAPGYVYYSSDLSEEEASKAAVYNYEGFGWNSEQNYFYLAAGDGEMMEGPIVRDYEGYTLDEEDPNWVYYIDRNAAYRNSKHIGVLYESEYAKLTPVGPAAPEQPTTPAQPEQPAVPAAPKAAAPSNDQFYVDGAQAVPTAYKIGGSNYFKIRDVAALLNGTDAQFSVDYDNATQSVILITGEGYEKKNSDLAGVPAGSREAVASNNAVYVNGEKVELTAYKIGGNNYFKLRDLGKVLGFYVGYTSGYGAFIETDKPYEG